MARSTQPDRVRGRRLAWSLAVLVLVGALIVGGLIVVYNALNKPLPWAERCAALVIGSSVEVDLEQARNASIIAGVAARRNLVPRAATIALATAYQESGIRNLDHGDRDSLGLFQQRPSQSWGTTEQIMDPYYASRAFYAAMGGVPDWQSSDIGDVAQQVQRSGYPDAYDKHVTNARLLASSLSGETPASFTCVVQDVPAGDPAGLAAFLNKTLPDADRVTRSRSTVTIEAPSTKNAWQAAHIAVANTKDYGVRTVTVGTRTWSPGASTLPSWETGTATAAATTVVVDLE